MCKNRRQKSLEISWILPLSLSQIVFVVKQTIILSCALFSETVLSSYVCASSPCVVLGHSSFIIFLVLFPSISPPSPKIQILKKMYSLMCRGGGHGSFLFSSFVCASSPCVM